MPTYQYRCEACDTTFDEFHGMSETVDVCGKCGSPVKRLVSSTFNIRKKSNSKKPKAGSLVDKYIKDVKEDIKAEKERLSSQEYKEP